MRLRRTRLLAGLAPNQIAPSTTNFPLMGASSSSSGGGGGGGGSYSPVSFTSPPTAPGGPYSESAFVSDACINPHPRFGTLTRNIRSRRGGKVRIRVPLFRDRRTPEFEGYSDKDKDAAAAATSAASAATVGEFEPLPFHLKAWDHTNVERQMQQPWPMVEGDCMAFGMGCCCLQVTFQSRNVSESRFM